MPVYKLMDEMPYDEMLGWFAYQKKRPFGHAEDSRTAMLMQASGNVKAKPHEMFSSLKIMYNNENERKKSTDTLDVNSLTASPFFQKVLANGNPEMTDLANVLSGGNNGSTD